MDRIVDAVLSLINEQKPFTAVCEGQRNTEEAQCTISKASQRDWSVVIAEFDEHSMATAFAHSWIHRNAFKVTTEDEPECLYRAILAIRQYNVAPKTGYVCLWSSLPGPRDSHLMAEREFAFVR